MKAWIWVFPTGAVMTIGGVFLCILMERLQWEEFGTTQHRNYESLIPYFIIALLEGAVITVVGSFLERRRLAVTQRRRGVVCWLVSGVSLLFLMNYGNIEGGVTFTFFFPFLSGFIAGAVLLI